MRNSGVEFAINATAIRSHNVNWDIYLNATNYSNKITRLPEANKKKTVEGHSGYATGNKFVGEGLSLNTFLMPKYAGVEPITSQRKAQYLRCMVVSVPASLSGTSTSLWTSLIPSVVKLTTADMLHS